MFSCADSELDCAIQDRDDLKYQLAELQRENKRLSDKIRNASPNDTSSRRELETLMKQRDEFTTTVNELQKENEKLKVFRVRV